MPTPTTPDGALKLRSAVPFRLRWEAPALANQPRRAAAVQNALEGQRGITAAEVNPRTGRLLVRHDRSLGQGDVEGLVRAALAAPPMTPSQYGAWLEAASRD